MNGWNTKVDIVTSCSLSYALMNGWNTIVDIGAMVLNTDII